MLYSCNKNNNVSALDYILDSNFGSVQGRGTPMKLGFGSPKKRGEDPCVKNSTSMRAIWQEIRAHYGFQSTGAHFLYNNIRLEPDERPEDLYQRLLSFIDDNSLTANGKIRHHGEDVSTDEKLTPSLEDMIVLTWLRLIHADLPTLVKQRYGTELRSQTLASLKPEISQALDALLDEIHSSNEAKVLRTAFRRSSQQRDNRSASSQPSNNKGGATKCCPICKQAKRS
jgi:hypothetical protein